MGRLIGRRLLLMVPTLILVSILVFALAEVLPGNLGRFILGPYATQSAVDQLNHSLGMDRPIYVRYVEWAGHFVTGHWGNSYQYSTPVFPFVMHARELAAPCRLRARDHRADVDLCRRLRRPAARQLP
jgi:peptide/nickel transport system permease protein